MPKPRYRLATALLELTLRCNMRCIHCGSSAGASRPHELTTPEWLTTITQLADLRCSLITLLGGEPLLHPDWNTIATAIKDRGMDVSYVTNGSLLTDDIIAKTRHLDPRTVVISLDGATPQTHDHIRQHPGSHARCLQALTKFKDADIRTSVITTVNTLNFTELPAIAQLLLDREIAWQIQIAVPIGRFPSSLILTNEQFYAVALFIANLQRTYSWKRLPVAGAHSIGYDSTLIPNTMVSPRWTGCQAGVNTIGIQSDGGIKGCLSLPDAYIEGNIRDTPLPTLWNDSNTFLYNRHFTPNDLRYSCKSCRHGKVCRGGCAAVSTALTNGPHADPFCLYRLEHEHIVTLAL
jgi:radical SAM protein with 4Fe4S-binding SPASM domain